MSCHLTTRFWQCVAVTWGGVVFALVVKAIEPVIIVLPFIWALVFSIVDGWWPQVSLLHARVSSERVIEGDEIELEIDLLSPRSLGWLEIEVQVPASMSPTESLRSVCSLEAATSRTVRFGLVARRWGVTGPDWVTLVARDRLGMTERVQHVPLAFQVRVHPRTERLASLIPPTTTRPVTGDHRSTRRGTGTELAAVRPYRAGDPVRLIHSRLSARRGEAMVLERHPDESADIVVFVDSVQDVGVGLETSLRWTVTAATALTTCHLGSMDRVGVLDRGAGVRWLPPKLGRRALHQIVDALLSTTVLRARMDDEYVVPVDRVPAGATIFCVSPLLSAVVRQDLLALRRRGHQVIAIQPELRRATSEGNGLAERVVRVGAQSRRTALTTQGVLVIPWNPDEPLEPTIRSMGQLVNRNRVFV